MEEYLQDWSIDSASVLEPLQPLASDWLVKKVPDSDKKVENLSRGETASRLLAELDEFKDETEPYYNWCEPEKIQLPILDDFLYADYYNANNDVKLNSYSVSPFAQDTFATNIQPDFTYDALAPASKAPFITDLKETKYDEQNQISKAEHEVLTPPESPKEEEILKLLEEMNPDVLEEFVRCEVDCLTNSDGSESGIQEEDFSDYVSSPFISSDSGVDDPVNSPVSLSSQVVPSKFKSAKCSQTKRKRMYKPYARVGGEDKKLRKKEQNKNAATRYRLKKKAEVEEVLEEEKELEVKNKELNEEVNEICREIKYLKSLMKEVYKAKGLIK